MQFGDPKKTVPLLVVAVLALGFCFKQLTGGGDQPKALRSGNAAQSDPGAQAPVGGTLVSLSLDQLRVDPFSHPRLAPKNVVDNGMAGTQQSLGNPDAPQTGITLPNGGGGGPFNPFSGPDIDKDRPGVWPSPVKGGTQPPVQVEKLTRVTLKAIVKVDQRMAFLSIDGDEARGYRAGEVIKGDLTVVFVNDDSVIVKTSKTTATLKVGQQGDL